MLVHNYIAISIRMKIMSEFREFLNEQLQDDEFREQWEKIQSEMDLIRADSGTSLSQIFDAREWT